MYYNAATAYQNVRGKEALTDEQGNKRRYRRRPERDGKACEEDQKKKEDWLGEKKPFGSINGQSITLLYW